MAQTVADNYFVKSPEKVYKTAHTFSKTLQKFTDMPSSISKTLDIKNFAEDKTDDIRYAIQQAKYQNQLYKRLQKADGKIRKSITKKIQQKDKKNQINLDQIKKKHEKDCQRVQKKLSQVYKKHVEIQKNKKMDKDQEALKLRQSLLEFYDKQKHRKKQADAKQLSVSTCYPDAVNRLQKIHRKNQQYAQKSQRQHLLRMSRNSTKDRNMLNLSRMKSAQNRKKQSVYIQNCQILKIKQHRYIQTYCKDLDQSLKAFNYKQNVQQKTKQRIKKFFKNKIQKWQTAKKRVDQQKQDIDQRCIDIMDKSSKAFFRQSVSSFKESGKNWFSKVLQNKSMIYEKDQRAKDRIMNIHLDLRLRNTSNFKINERMLSMRGQAKKLSHEFL